MTSVADQSNVEWTGFFPELGGVFDIDDILTAVSGRSLADYASAPRPTPHVLGRESDQVPCAVDFETDTVLRTFPRVVTRDARARLAQVVHSHSAAVSPQLVGPLEERLLAAVMRLTMRCLASELHKLREAGELAGANTRARYDSFHRRVLTKGFVHDMYGNYPAMAAQISRLSDQYVASVSEILSRVAAARSAIAVTFDIDPGSRLSEIGADAGDTHRGGRSVAVLRFACGASLVYKPRSLAPDIAFHRILEWCGELPGGTTYATPVYLDRGDHGFMEYLQHEPLTDGAAQLNYYARTGELTAVLYALNGCDVHYENLLVKNGEPVAIDLETVFVEQLREDSLGERTTPREAIDCLSTSVLQIGTLPRVLFGAEGDREYDVSALGHRPARSPRRIHHVLDDHTDRMRIAFDFLDLDNGVTIPTLQDAADNTELVARFTEGFIAQYRRLASNRDELARLVRTRFDDVPVRYVNSETIFYGQLLRMGTNPSIMRDPMAREVLMHRVALRHRSRPPAMVRAEVDDLLAGDVPYFEARTTSCSLWDSRGTEIPEVFDIAPMERVLAKIARLGEADLAIQRRLIDSTMVNKLPDDAVVTGLRPVAPGDHIGTFEKARYLQTICEIADRLCTTAFEGTKDIPTDWICLNVSRASDSHGWFPGTLGLDVYGGRPGIALALAAASRVAGDLRYASLARSVVEPMIGLIQPGGDFHNERSASGMYMGHAGFVRALHDTGRLLEDDSLVDAAFDVLGTAEALIDVDKVYDIIMGSAGVLATAVHLHGRAQSDSHRAIAARIAAHAAAKIASSQSHIWDVQEPRMSGYAHGAAGYYPWLYAAGAITDASFDGAAEWFLDVERSMRTADGDWTRDSSEDSRSYAWCHGAPGILLAKEIAIEHRPDLAAGFRDEIADARRLTYARGFGNNVTYCHGDLGTIEILRRYAGRVGDDELALELNATFARLHRSYLADFIGRSGCRYSLVNSLMIGQAGVLHALCRELAPHDVDSVLW